MAVKHAVGIALFCMVAIIAFGLFCTGDVRNSTAPLPQHSEWGNMTNITHPDKEISSYHVTQEEQIEVSTGWVLVMIIVLGLMYAGGIVYDERSHVIRDAFRDENDE